MEDSEELGDMTECPFCGEIFDNLPSHIRECEFAPDDASMEDILPSKAKKKTKVEKKGGTKETVKKTCPYCRKDFQRLGRHLSSCPKKPKDADEKKDAE